MQGQLLRSPALPPDGTKKPLRFGPYSHFSLKAISPLSVKVKQQALKK